jgi:hypothetical protein
MGLDCNLCVSGLTASWPTSGEPKSQGDDHLRLLKSVLQATFPNATKPYYLPAANVLTGNTTLTSVSQNSIVFCSTASAAFTVALPTLDSTQGGWSVEIVKYSTDGNYVAVVPPDGNIFTQFGAVASVCVGVANTPAKFVWSGGAWYSFKLGPMIGETTNWHGPTIPAGYLPLSGYSYTGSFNAGIYTELYLALGNVATLYDVRGRIEAGLDPGVSRLTTNTMPGGGHIMGSAAGAELHTLTATQCRVMRIRRRRVLLGIMLIRGRSVALILLAMRLLWVGRNGATEMRQDRRMLLVRRGCMGIRSRLMRPEGVCGTPLSSRR